MTGQFARTYDGIRESAREYKIADVQAAADFVVDLNSDAGVAELRKVIDTYRSETILYMETLEHVNDHFEVMNVLAYAVKTTDPPHSSLCLTTGIGFRPLPVALADCVGRFFFPAGELGVCHQARARRVLCSVNKRQSFGSGLCRLSMLTESRILSRSLGL